MTGTPSHKRPLPMYRYMSVVEEHPAHHLDIVSCKLHTPYCGLGQRFNWPYPISYIHCFIGLILKR